MTQVNAITVSLQPPWVPSRTLIEPFRRDNNITSHDGAIGSTSGRRRAKNQWAQRNGALAGAQEELAGLTG